MARAEEEPQVPRESTPPREHACRSDLPGPASGNGHASASAPPLASPSDRERGEIQGWCRHPSPANHRNPHHQLPDTITMSGLSEFNVAVAKAAGLLTLKMVPRVLLFFF